MAVTLDSFSFDIPGQPVPKGRPRVFNGRGVTPKATRDAEARVRAVFRKMFYKAQPIDGPVEMSVTFYMSDRRRVDFDNLAKLICDALNGVAFSDDAQVRGCKIDKILPSEFVPGKKGLRKRQSGDVLLNERTFDPYDPHTHVFICRRRDLH